MSGVTLTDGILRQLWPRCPDALRVGILVSAPAVLEQFKVNTPLRLAHAMAQFSEESGGGTVTHESLNFSTASRLREVWPSRFKSKSDAELARLLHNERVLADAVYNGRMGNRPGTEDGFNYRGRGLIQTTGRDGYAALGKIVGLNLVGNPNLIVDPQHAFLCAIAEFCEVAKCLPYADNDNLLAVSSLINVGHLVDNPALVVGYAERKAWLARWKVALANAPTRAAPTPPNPIPLPPKTSKAVAAAVTVSVGAIGAHQAGVPPTPVIIVASILAVLLVAYFILRKK